MLKCHYHYMMRLKIALDFVRDVCWVAGSGAVVAVTVIKWLTLRLVQNVLRKSKCRNRNNLNKVHFTHDYVPQFRSNAEFVALEFRDFASFGQITMNFRRYQDAWESLFIDWDWATHTHTKTPSNKGHSANLEEINIKWQIR